MNYIQLLSGGQHPSIFPLLTDSKGKEGSGLNTHFQQLLMGATLSEGAVLEAGDVALDLMSQAEHSLLEHPAFFSTDQEELKEEIIQLMIQLGLQEGIDLLEELWAAYGTEQSSIDPMLNRLEPEQESSQLLLQRLMETEALPAQVKQELGQILALFHYMEQGQQQQADFGGSQNRAPLVELLERNIIQLASMKSQAQELVASELKNKAQELVTSGPKNTMQEFVASGPKNSPRNEALSVQQGNASYLLTDMLQKLKTELHQLKLTEGRLPASNELRMSTFMPISLMGSVEPAVLNQPLEAPIHHSLPAQTGITTQQGATPTTAPGSTMQTVIEELQTIYRSHLQAIKQGDSQSIRLQLHPAHLGQLDIRVSAKDGLITAELMTSTKAAQALIELQMNQLRLSLIQQGIQVDKIEVTQQSSSSNHLFEEQHSKSGQQPFQQESKKGTAEPNQPFEQEEEDQLEQSRIVTADSQIDYAV